MNLLLLEPGEWAAEPPEVTVTGRRAEHLLQVLQVGLGDTIRCGVLNGGVGTATVQSMTQGKRDSVTLAVRLEGPAPAAADSLLLAIPRPKVLQRVLSHAAALGFGEVVLVRTWTCDRSHVEAVQRRIDGDLATGHGPFDKELRRGLEQGRRTRLPSVRCEPLFKPFVEDRLPGLWSSHQKLVAHPTAARAAWHMPPTSKPVALALGPERGFTGYEVERLAAGGMLPVHAGPHPVRTETALALLTGLAMACRARA